MKQIAHDLWVYRRLRVQDPTGAKRPGLDLRATRRKGLTQDAAAVFQSEMSHDAAAGRRCTSRAADAQLSRADLVGRRSSTPRWPPNLNRTRTELATTMHQLRQRQVRHVRPRAELAATAASRLSSSTSQSSMGSAACGLSEGPLASPAAPARAATGAAGPSRASVVGFVAQGTPLSTKPSAARRWPGRVDRTHGGGEGA